MPSASEPRPWPAGPRPVRGARVPRASARAPSASCAGAVGELPGAVMSCGRAAGGRRRAVDELAGGRRPRLPANDARARGASSARSRCVAATRPGVRRPRRGQRSLRGRDPDEDAVHVRGRHVLAGRLGRSPWSPPGDRAQRVPGTVVGDEAERGLGRRAGRVGADRGHRPREVVGDREHGGVAAVGEAGLGVRRVLGDPGRSRPRRPRSARP